MLNIRPKEKREKMEYQARDVHTPLEPGSWGRGPEPFFSPRDMSDMDSQPHSHLCRNIPRAGSDRVPNTETVCREVNERG